MRMQVTLHRQPQARWSMTSHLQEVARRVPAESRILAESERAVSTRFGSLPEREAVQVAPPGR